MHFPGVTFSFISLNEYILHMKHVNELFLKVLCMYIMFINIRFKCVLEVVYWSSTF